MKKKIVRDVFDPEVLRNIAAMDHSTATEHCKSLVEGTSTKPNKKQALLRDIDNAPNSQELSRIMWNVMLAGEGLATTNSIWQAHYG